MNYIAIFEESKNSVVPVNAHQVFCTMTTILSSVNDYVIGPVKALHIHAFCICGMFINVTGLMSGQKPSVTKLSVDMVGYTLGQVQKIRLELMF